MYGDESGELVCGYWGLKGLKGIGRRPEDNRKKTYPRRELN